MSKGIMISFRTTAELNASLKHLAEANKTSLSGLIDEILHDYLESQNTQSSPSRDRRRFPRQHETIPAIICGRNGRQNLFHSSKITDLSLGGISITVPQDDLSDACLNERLKKFEVIFALPRQDRPISIQCQTRRIQRGMDGYQVGACFADADLNSYQALQGYLA